MSNRGIQLQTTDGRLHIVGNATLCCIVLLFLTVNATASPAVGTDPKDQWGLAAFGIGVVLLRAVARLRRSGLWVSGDGKLLIRGAGLTFSTKPAQALDVLQVRSERSGAELRMRVVGDQSQAATGLRRLEYRPAGHQLRSPRRNELLVRDLRRVRGRWTRTGIVWSDDDDTFLETLAALVDAALGAPAESACSADLASTRGLAAPAPTLRAVATDTLGPPVFRTSHSLVTRHGWRLRTVANALGVIAWLSFGFIQFAWAVGAITLGAGVGALWLWRRSTTPQVSVATRQRLQSRSELRTLTPKPTSLTVVGEHHGEAVLAAIDPRGHTIPLTPLKHHSVLVQPNELLVRYPRAARDADSDWHGTGVFWGDDGDAIRTYLEGLLRNAA